MVQVVYIYRNNVQGTVYVHLSCFWKANCALETVYAAILCYADFRRTQLENWSRLNIW